MLPLPVLGKDVALRIGQVVVEHNKIKLLADVVNRGTTARDCCYCVTSKREKLCDSRQKNCVIIDA